MKYIKLYFKYAKLSIMSKLSYKSNTIIGILAFLFTEITSILTLFIIVSQVPELNGWDRYQIALLYGITNLAIGIDHLFTDKLWNVAYFEVRSGSMDSLFLRPLPVLFQTIACEIQLEALGEILTAIFLIVFCASNLALIVNFSSILLLAVGIICASLLISSFKIIIASMAFAFKRTGPFLQIIYNFANYSKYPLNIFPKIIRFAFTFLIPLGLCIFYPVSNLFQPLDIGISPYLLIVIIISITVVMLILAVLIWNYFAKRYESTGS
ncbi:MAG: ABC-2 family transporter protein [Erysipelotrichales bacterium]|nr:ABC-2 family transporter protein [Erysipelotrichales bacterium]